ncbi:hypothetical protein SMSP2_02064 [Limihaloglobus sulfuriphilus]|uniref:PEP-CTERM protein-sorting domain-containing protein n=1 Tax=Limihaloglobus sulfuriphilus TaxID=1851148 RepID=A0A1Q2MHB5_9BACT|nr:PEP-CTERM sorting domain-containing protein [Limihaloglobus sulfuriphilus]AQQ71687.1 hypothetical protein SMSP2_02064 [Limihaloglobus sulfuriphilus]
MRAKICTVLTSMLVVALAGSASFGSIIYESFDYEAGSLVGQNGGQGWGGSWNMPSTNGTQEVTAESLSFSSYQTSGGALKLVKQADPGTFVSVGVRRQLGFDFTAGDDVWVSFLSKSDGELSAMASRTAEVRHGATLGTTKLRIRPKGSGSQGIMVAYDGSASNSAAKSAQDGRTYLNIVRFGDIGTADGKFAVMWTFEEAGYNAMIADGIITEDELNQNYYLNAQDPHENRTLNSLDSVYINLSDSQDPNFGYYFDELRYGTSLSDVLVIPEPMTMLLLGFGGLAVLRKKS